VTEKHCRQQSELSGEHWQKGVQQPLAVLKRWLADAPPAAGKLHTNGFNPFGKMLTPPMVTPGVATCVRKVEQSKLRLIDLFQRDDPQ
jgi:hypothetical protein